MVEKPTTQYIVNTVLLTTPDKESMTSLKMNLLTTPLLGSMTNCLMTPVIPVTMLEKVMFVAWLENERKSA